GLHILIFRYFKPERRFRTLTLIFYFLIGLYFVLYYLVPHGFLEILPLEAGSPNLSQSTFYKLSNFINFVSGFMLYVFLWLGYCQFYFIVDRSISVRIMIELENSKEKALTYDEIKSCYTFDHILTRRLGHMVEGGYLKKEGDKYVNTKKGETEGRFFRFMKDYLNLGIGG
ncbi:MAG: hypothetical protein V3T30_03585, partial [Thermodesulfobacteriota bacterium]